MIRQALVALGPRSMVTGVLVGGAALALGALFLPRVERSAAPGMYRLALFAAEEDGAFYLSAWADGDVFIAANEQKSITFVRRSDEHDGCSWQGTEKLTRVSRRVFAYDYAETILSCEPGATPFRKTPRTGFVTLESWSAPATATALTAVQPPGQLWNTAMNDVVEDGCMDRDDADDADDVDEALADAQRELADAQEELADAHQEVEEAVDQSGEKIINMLIAAQSQGVPGQMAEVK